MAPAFAVRLTSQEIRALIDPHLAQLRRALEGRYDIMRVLGRGGMGVVCLARDCRLDRRVAIKVLPPDKALHPAARERFLREARMAAQLSHPHIVPVHSVGEIGDLVFFVMAYIEGQTLGQRVRTGGPLSAGLAARVLRDVASALAYAHARGIVHRDVKPDNILLEEGTGRALVTDFGIAHGGTPAVTPGASTVVGTAEFMSPEQARGEPGDARSDLYSLGVTAFYVLSGRVPFEGADGYAVIAQHLADPAPALVSVAPTVPRTLAHYIDRCLAKEPAQRPSGGVEFAAEVLQAVGEAPPAPLAVRAFLTESRRLSGPAYAYVLCTGLGVLPVAERTLLFTA
ncbi:MAG TPA: serine/threonine-protein kinase, partial [Gemmatimonadales bacterium]|nr:serine/threonine-protein kinase [Gemmatimonadales bacterium]